METLNYGIISSASIVPRFVSALNVSKHSKAYAIGASQLSKAQNMANELGIPKAYGSYKEVYEDPEVDVVYIANINDQHFTQIMEALSHNKHVICEKPMVLKTEHVIEAFAYAKEQGLFLMEAQKSVFLPTMQYIKEKIKDKEFGELRQATLNASWIINQPKDHWMYDHHQAGVLFSSAFWSSNKLNIYDRKSDKDVTLAYDETPEMIYEINHIYECIHKGLNQSPIMSEDITRTCVNLVNEIYQESFKE